MKVTAILILSRMKVTAILSDKLVNEVRTLSKGKNITESLTIALEDWVSIQKINSLNKKIKDKPLKFKDDFSAEKVRELNRDQ